MKRYGGLYERLLDHDNLTAAVLASARRKRHRAPVARCLSDVDGTAERIGEIIRSGFAATPPTVRVIYDARRCKERTICCPRYYPDQIIHHALMQVLIPCVMRGMSDHCMASVPGRGEHLAVKRAARWLEQDRRGTRYCYQFDVRHFYQSINHGLLKARLRRLVKDERFLSVLFAVIDGYPGDGLPIGFYTSQWLANLFLQDLDHLISERLGAAHFVRYMDDVIVFGPNKRKLHRARREIEAHLRSIGLSVKPNWQVYRMACRPVEFLGFQLRRGHTKLRSRTFLALSRRLRRIGRKRTPTARDARAAMSYLGMARHVTGDAIMQRHVYPYVSIRQLKGIIRHAEREHREAASGKRGARGRARARDAAKQLRTGDAR